MQDFVWLAKDNVRSVAKLLRTPAKHLEKPAAMIRSVTRSWINIIETPPADTSQQPPYPVDQTKSAAVRRLSYEERVAQAIEDLNAALSPKYHIFQATASFDYQQ